MGLYAPTLRRASKPRIDEQGMWVDLEIAYQGSCCMTLSTKVNLWRLAKDSKIEREMEDIQVKKEVKEKELPRSVWDERSEVIKLVLMDLSFVSPAPGYSGTSRDHGYICSLEADKSAANIRRLPRRAGHLWCRVTDKVPGLVRTLVRSQLKFMAQMITIKPWLQFCTCSLPAAMSAYTNALHYHNECPAIARIPGAGIQMIGA